MPQVRAHTRRRPHEAEFRQTTAELRFNVLMRDLDRNLSQAFDDLMAQIEREDREQAERIRGSF